MADITFRIPDEVYKKMKKYSEVSWSEIAKKAITDYVSKLEEDSFELTTGELLEVLGEDFKRNLGQLSLEKAIEGYEKMRQGEWRRLSTTQVR